MSQRGRPLVVVVEDEEDSRELLKELLEHHGYRVRTAVNGRTALELLDELGDQACVMLLDLFMPVLDGWGVYEQLKADGKLEQVRVLITTSAPHRAPAGATVLEKPIDIPKLLEILATHCAAP
jgi:two-component system chemotaxis sensor kinase CheA